MLAASFMLTVSTGGRALFGQFHAVTSPSTQPHPSFASQEFPFAGQSVGTLVFSLSFKIATLQFIPGPCLLP